LSALLVVTALATGIAILQREAAQAQQRVALARQLIAQADVVRDRDPNTAIRLEIAANFVYDDAETRAKLGDSVLAARFSGRLTGHTARINSMSLAPDGRTLATASNDMTVRLWDI